MYWVTNVVPGATSGEKVEKVFRHMSLLYMA